MASLSLIVRKEASRIHGNAALGDGGPGKSGSLEGEKKKKKVPEISSKKCRSAGDGEGKGGS